MNGERDNQQVISDGSHPLDNPMWTSLNTRLSQLNESSHPCFKHFPIEVSPFVATEHWSENEISNLIDALPSGREASFAVYKPVDLPTDRVQILVAIPLYQMTCESFQPFLLPDDALQGFNIRPCTTEDVPQMVQLAELTKPGPFRSRTMEFGGFLGLFDNENKLIAMAGNRMKVPGYTEVSGICTDPAYLGKGYASHLTTLVCQEILSADEKCIPFLNVKADNLRAIKVYKKLGFRVRIQNYYYIFKRL
jgi:ribosomal protein S18 acetylase RimI-like enzyme